MGKAARGAWAPAGVARRERFAHTRRQSLSAHPWRVPGHQIEPTVRHHLREMGLERKERGGALQTQFSARGPQLTQALPQACQPEPLREVEAAPAAEQVAIATG